MKRFVCSSGAVLFVALLVVAAWAQTLEAKRGITPEDYFAFEFLSDPHLSPDGKKLAFVSDRTGKAFDESRNTDVWVISAEGGPLTKISDHAEEDNSPRWSPDGRIDKVRINRVSKGHLDATYQTNCILSPFLVCLVRAA